MDALTTVSSKIGNLVVAEGCRTPLVKALMGGNIEKIIDAIHKQLIEVTVHGYCETTLSFVIEEVPKVFVSILVDLQQGPFDVLHVLPVLKELAPFFTNVNAPNDDGTIPLHVLCDHTYEFYELAELLVNSNADLTWTSSSLGRSCLYTAASHGHDQIVKLLIKKGADIDAIDEDGRTPLMGAISSKQIFVVDALLKAGANVDKTGLRCKTPLHIATWINDIGIVRLLLKANADLELTDSNNMTALAISLVKGYHEIMEVLLEAGSVTQLSYQKDDMFLSGLELAIANGQFKCASFLLQNPKFQPTDFGYALNMCAIAENEKDAVQLTELLLQKDAKVDSPTAENCTPLMQTEHASVVSILVRAGANVSKRNVHGRNALHYAAKHSKKAGVICTLVKLGCDLFTVDTLGCKPIDLASGKTKELFELLMTRS